MAQSSLETKTRKEESREGERKKSSCLSFNGHTDGTAECQPQPPRGRLRNMVFVGRWASFGRGPHLLLLLNNKEALQGLQTSLDSLANVLLDSRLAIDYLVTEWGWGGGGSALSLTKPAVLVSTMQGGSRQIYRMSTASILAVWPSPRDRA